MKSHNNLLQLDIGALEQKKLKKMTKTKKVGKKKTTKTTNKVILKKKNSPNNKNTPKRSNPVAIAKARPSAAKTKTPEAKSSVSVAKSGARSTTPKVLVAKSLEKSFSLPESQQQIAILRGLNLEIAKGETVSIMGRSGSGKSTLLSVLAGLEPPDSGEIHLDGKDMSSMNEAELSTYRASKLSIIFQHFHLVSHLTALDNVELPLKILGRPLEKKAQQALEQVGLADRLTHFPHQLSGGEQQRLAIARSMVINPLLLLADEPTGNLDYDTAKKVVEALFGVVKKNNIALLLVTHDMDLAKRCKKRYLLNEGKLTSLSSAKRR